MSAAAPALRAAVFDFDGTLVDASDAIVHSFNAALRARGRPARPREEVVAMIGRPLFEMYGRVAPDAGAEEIRALIEAYRAEFHPVCVAMSRALPGLRECIAALRPRLRLAIATNRQGRGARQMLEGLGLAGAFGVLVGIDDVARTKPAPDAVHAALGRLGCAAAEAVLVGDTPEDMAAAVAAGVEAIGVTTGIHGPDALRRAGAAAVVASLHELPPLLLPRAAPAA